MPVHEDCLQIVSAEWHCQRVVVVVVVVCVFVCICVYVNACFFVFCNMCATPTDVIMGRHNECSILRKKEKRRKKAVEI